MKLPGQRWLLALLCLAEPAFLQAADENLWPLRTSREVPASRETRVEALGPLFFDHQRPDRHDSGFRPLFLHRELPAENRTQDYCFFPFFFRETRDGNTRWNVFSLINSDRRAGEGVTGAEAAKAADWRAFDLWPFYFSRETGDPATSYHALLPLHGRILRRFGNDRIDFTLFPLYSRWQKGERVETDWLWPFFREIHGGGESGFALWPLYGQREKAGAGAARSRFALWPVWLERDRTVEGGEDRFRALLPFYAQRRAPTLRDDSYLIFFGSTHQTGEVTYNETRLLWPLFVQGRGSDGRVTNRWAPFYTHSVKPGGDDKRWVLWPLFREENWTDAGLAQTKTQFLYFVYWNLEQRDPARPAAAHATKTHLWPRFSAWDHGAGRRQVQALSPFEVFYQHDDRVRQLWSPLFALYRLDRRSPEAVRTSFLFDLVTYQRESATWRFELGPLFRLTREDARIRFALLPALFDRHPPAPASAPAPSAGQP